MKGEVAIHAGRGEMKKALQAAEEYWKIFPGADSTSRFRATGWKTRRALKPAPHRDRTGARDPLVATNDCHYLRREDAKAHEVLLCIQTGKTLKDQDRMRFAIRRVLLQIARGDGGTLSEPARRPVAIRSRLPSNAIWKLRFDQKHIPRIDGSGRRRRRRATWRNWRAEGLAEDSTEILVRRKDDPERVRPVLEPGSKRS